MVLPHPAKEARGAARVSTMDPLQQSFFKLFVRSYRDAEKQRRGAGLGVYRYCAALTYRLCMEPWAQFTIFPKETRAMRRFLADTGIQVEDEKACISLSLMAHIWAPTWTNVILKMERPAFVKICRISGLDHLRTAKQSGRGILLAHSHTLFTQLFWRWLEHASIDPGTTLWAWTWSRQTREIEDPKIRVTESAREMRAALQALKQGDMVHVLADGGRGGGKQIEVAFFNRRRTFQTTFADLALTANSVILTVDVYVEKNGVIAIDIGPPLQAGNAKLERVRKIETLVMAFISHLKKQWERSPGNLPWRQMGRQIEYPKLEGSVR